MSEISKIDRNFSVKTQLKEEGLHFYSVLEPPFRVHGVFMEQGQFCRLPGEVAKKVSQSVYDLHIHTAGGRVQFKTDSPYVAISAKINPLLKMPHFALAGSAGFDLYADEGQGETYVNTFVPPYDMTEGYESVVRFHDRKLRTVTVNFPLYSGVTALYIGLDRRAALEEADPYRVEKPVVFYGSSITQGGCASRPGNTYQAILSRRFSFDYINLGFSGSARGEKEISDYISGLSMSAFVYDYDHNAPTVEHLAATHRRMFEEIRGAQPQLPILILSRPKYTLTREEEERLAIIRATYAEAKRRGDEKVYLITGKDLCRLCENNGTVDNCHPNDYGFASMAKAVETVMAEHIFPD